jgi:hypothetical protein
MSDLLRKYKSLYSSTTNTFSTGESVTITPASVTGLPTDTEITLTFDRVDATGTKTPDKMERIRGTISGSNFVVSSGGRAVEGTEQVHTAPVVEMVWNADDLNDIVDWGLAEHGQDGKHTSALVTSLKASGAVVNTGTSDTTIVTPKAIADSDIPNVKATATENVTGTDDAKYLTALANVPAFNNSMARQAIINGNFPIAQRGTSFTNPTNGDFTLDHWKISYGVDGGTPPTLTHTQQLQTSGDLYGSKYFYRIATNGAGSGYGANSYYGLVQRVEHGTSLLAGLNKKVTISFNARSSITDKKLGLFLSQNYGTGGSPSSEETIAGTTVTLTSSWVRYSFTYTTNTLVGKTFGTANDDYLQFWFLGQIGSGLSAARNGTTIASWEGSGNIDISEVEVNAGDVALPFMPKSFEEELRACQRYYYRPITDKPYMPYGIGLNESTTICTIPYRLPVEMRTTPALETSGTASHYRVISGSSSVNCSVVPSIDTANSFTKSGGNVIFTVASGLTANSIGYVGSNNTASSYLAFNAEL